MFDPSLNPHTYQNSNCNYIEKLERILTDDYPQLKYSPRKSDEDRSTVHFGQRKLHLSEIEFLTNFCAENDNLKDKKIVLIYAGAAPGIHISKLSAMFPFVKFVLVDPADFKVEINDMIETIQDFFTDDMAKKMRRKYNDFIRLFISDIRVFGPGSVSEDKLEEKVEEDMVAQMRWYYLLEPKKSMLKFRLPYVGDKSDRKLTMDYLEGEVYFQIWAPGSSSETRLVVSENAKLKTYDSVKYENQLYRFNQVARVSCYKHDISVAGFDHCYDCRAEVFVYEEYVKLGDKLTMLSKKPLKINTVKEYIEDLNDFLNAKAKYTTITKAGKNYGLKFTDIRYGKKFNQVCNERTLTNRARRTYLNRSTPYNLPKKAVLKRLDTESHRKY